MEMSLAPIKHGDNQVSRRTKLYGRWLTMRNKCTNPNHQAYKWYGARGIKVCERWNDFGTFRQDVGEIPGPGMTLDRIDNDGNYEPGNVRWATAEIQANNKQNGVGNRGVHLITLRDGRRLSIAQAAKAMGVNPRTPLLSSMNLSHQVSPGIIGQVLARWGQRKGIS
jgi:hypothetical protein